MNQLAIFIGGAMRRVWALIVWRAAIFMWCRRLRIEGRSRVPSRPVIVAANHSSHADTVLLQFALATCHEQPVLVAGAEDYWFRNPLLGAFAQALGVIAFPRKGEIGVHRVARALNRRASVVLFPQGSRSGGRFRAGIGRIARRSDAEVLPVHVAGTQELLPKGRIWPQRTDIVVRFGEPITPKPSETPEAFAARLERIVLVDLGKAA